MGLTPEISAPKNQTVSTDDYTSFGAHRVLATLFLLIFHLFFLYTTCQLFPFDLGDILMMFAL